MSGSPNVDMDMKSQAVVECKDWKGYQRVPKSTGPASIVDKCAKCACFGGLICDTGAGVNGRELHNSIRE
eukprot:scaffold185966_cov19-Tisochrysis_lutea.AAC.1